MAAELCQSIALCNLCFFFCDCFETCLASNMPKTYSQRYHQSAAPHFLLPAIQALTMLHSHCIKIYRKHRNQANIWHTSLSSHLREAAHEFLQRNPVRHCAERILPQDSRPSKVRRQSFSLAVRKTSRVARSNAISALSSRASSLYHLPCKQHLKGQQLGLKLKKKTYICIYVHNNVFWCPEILFPSHEWCENNFYHILPSQGSTIDDVTQEKARYNDIARHDLHRITQLNPERIPMRTNYKKNQGMFFFPPANLRWILGPLQDPFL